MAIVLISPAMKLHKNTNQETVMVTRSDAANVRIANGVKTSTVCYGLLQVYHNNTWGTVCDDGWNTKNTKIVCRQLGYAYGSYMTLGGGSGRIWLDDVSCTGRETSIDECRHKGWGIENCDHSEDVGVLCYSGLPDIAFRLRDKTNAHVFGLEARFFGTWGAVCGDIDLEDALVICRMAGYSKALWVYKQLSNNSLPIRFSIRMTCNGGESSTDQCSYVGLKEEQSCSGNQDTRLICQRSSIAFAKTSKLRLVGGSSAGEGRVEIQQYGVWGTVCNRGWDIRDANVVCRMLNFTEAITARHRFGSGTGPIWLTDVSCTGYEMDIMNCTHGGLGQTRYCSHANDAGVICHSHSVNVTNVAVRLVDGGSPSQGRVEVRYYGIWGTVCNDGWDIADSRVVCRMLNFSKASWAGTAKVSGSGRILLDDVGCRGDEKSLEDCRHRGWGVHDCGLGDDAAVRCMNETNDKANVRLTNGVKTTSFYFGILQVYHNNTWGTVCDDGWNTKNTKVVCRQLGYTNGSSHMSLGRGSGRIWLDDVSCTGLESAIGECGHSGWGNENCGHQEDVGVLCYTGSPNIAFRLRGTPNGHIFGLEASFFGTWGSVCGDIGLEDGHVICRMAGYSKALWGFKHLSNARLPIRFSIRMTCNGGENSTDQCSYVGLKEKQSCSSNIYVMCQPATGSATDVAVRLKNGKIPNEGRVEVRYYGVWGTVCDDDWDLADAHVVCRMLNYSKASWAGTAEVSGSGAIWLDDVQCHGDEKSLEECRHGGLGIHNCRHQEDAAVRCINVTVRLVKSNQRHIGQVEVNYMRTWRPVCDDTWDISDAHVVCRMLGYQAALAPIRQYRKGVNGLWMGGVECSGRESSINECSHRGWSNTRCPGNYQAGVMCKVNDDLPPVQVRLEDGSSPNSGRVAVRYGNVWGTICNRGLDINDAKVICRMLGYTGKSAVYPKMDTNLIFKILGYCSKEILSQYTFGPPRPIWLSDLECKGTERSIVDCSHPGWGQTTCTHEQDAAITCTTADPPHFKINGTEAIKESTVVILVNDTQPIYIQRLSVYQVAVEIKKSAYEQRLSSRDQPPPFVFNEVNVTMATQMGNNDRYITAEIVGPISSLTIGDGQYYHGYYNAPLEPGSMYRVHVRIVTMAMDGKRIYGKSGFVAFMTKTGEKIKSIEKRCYQVESAAGAGNCTGCHKTTVIALSLVVVVHLIILITIGGVWYWYKKRNAAGNTSEVLEMNENGTDSQTEIL